MCYNHVIVHGTLNKRFTRYCYKYCLVGAITDQHAYMHTGHGGKFDTLEILMKEK
jgi:hypothetical protein